VDAAKGFDLLADKHFLRGKTVRTIRGAGAVSGHAFRTETTGALVVPFRDAIWDANRKGPGRSRAVGRQRARGWRPRIPLLAGARIEGGVLRFDMPPEVASSAERVPRSRIRELADIAMKMDGVVRLYFGESNLPTPDCIKRAAIEALEAGFTYYTENAGLPSLRKSLAAHYRLLHGVELDPDREIVITASGVQALSVAIRALLNPGDEAIVLTPAWPNGSSIVAMSNAVPVEIPHLLAGPRYAIDFARLEQAVTSRTRMVLCTSPSNPLGWVATEEEQKSLLEFCRQRGLWLMADEVYERLYYRGGRAGEPAPSILRLASRRDAVVVIQSFSKAYCMTGWRVGWLVARDDLAEKVTELNEFMVSHAASFSQKAAEAALALGEKGLVAMVERLAANRDFCVAALTRMPGVTVPQPDGAFYLFPRIAGLTDSFEFCRSLLSETKVGLAPGVAFGEGGEGSVRLCYAAERSLLETAMERLGEFLRKR
jgi:aspartate aminotransferase